MGWKSRILTLGVVGYIGYATYDLYKGGYFSMPDLPNGAYPVSFKSGLRGILIDATVSDTSYADSHWLLRNLSNANPDRRYLGLPFDVPAWFEDAWSTCIAPDDQMESWLESQMPDETKQSLIGARLEAFCYIDMDDGERIMRGLVYSVPRT